MGAGCSNGGGQSSDAGVVSPHDKKSSQHNQNGKIKNHSLVHSDSEDSSGAANPLTTQSGTSNHNDSRHQHSPSAHHQLHPSLSMRAPSHVVVAATPALMSIYKRLDTTDYSSLGKLLTHLGSSTASSKRQQSSTKFVPASWLLPPPVGELGKEGEGEDGEYFTGDGSVPQYKSFEDEMHAIIAKFTRDDGDDDSDDDDDDGNNHNNKNSSSKKGSSSQSSSSSVNLANSAAFCSAISILRNMTEFGDMAMMVRTADQINQQLLHHPSSKNSTTSSGGQNTKQQQCTRLFGADAPLLDPREIQAQIGAGGDNNNNNSNNNTPSSSSPSNSQVQQAPLQPNQHLLTSSDRDAVLFSTGGIGNGSSSTRRASTMVVTSSGGGIPGVIRAICRALSVVITAVLRHVALEGLLPFVKQGKSSAAAGELESPSAAAKFALDSFLSDGEMWGSILKGGDAPVALSNVVSKGGNSCLSAMKPILKTWVSRGLKVVYSYTGGLENICASDTEGASNASVGGNASTKTKKKGNPTTLSSTSPSPTTTEDVSLQSLIEIKGISRMWFLAKLLGFDPFGGMRTSDEASEAAAVVYVIGTTIGILSSSTTTTTSNNTSSSSSSSFKSWYPSFPHFFMSTEGRCNALFLESVLHGQHRLQLQPLRRGNILSSASLLIPGPFGASHHHNHQQHDSSSGGGVRTSSRGGSSFSPKRSSFTSASSPLRIQSGSGGGRRKLGSSHGINSGRVDDDTTTTNNIMMTTTYKVFPLFSKDGIGLEAGEGHGPRKEFFDGCGLMATANVEAEIDLMGFLKGGRAIVLSTGPSFKETTEGVLEALLLSCGETSSTSGSTTMTNAAAFSSPHHHHSRKPPLSGTTPTTPYRKNTQNHQPSSSAWANMAVIKKDLLSPLQNGTLLLLEPATTSLATLEFLSHLKQGDSIRFTLKHNANDEGSVGDGDGGGTASSSSITVKRVVQIIQNGLVLVELQGRVPTAELTLPHFHRQGDDDDDHDESGGGGVLSRLPFLRDCKLTPSCLPPLVHERNKQFAWLNPAMISSLSQSSHNNNNNRPSSNASSPSVLVGGSGSLQGGLFAAANSNLSTMPNSFSTNQKQHSSDGLLPRGDALMWTIGWCIGNAASNGCTLPVSLPPLLFYLAKQYHTIMPFLDARSNDVNRVVENIPFTTDILALLNADSLLNAQKALRWSVEEFTMVLRVEADDDGSDFDNDDDDDDEEGNILNKIRNQNQQKQKQDHQIHIQRIASDKEYFKSELDMYVLDTIVLGAVFGGGSGTPEGASGRLMIKKLLEGFRSSPLSSSPAILYASPRTVQQTLCGGTDDGTGDFSFSEWFRFLMDRELTHFAHGRVFKDLLLECLENTTDTTTSNNNNNISNLTAPQRKRQLLKFITGRTLLPSREKEEHIKVDLPLLPMSAKDFDRILPRLPSSHSCDNVLELPNYLEGLLFGTKSPFYAAAGKKVGSMVMDSHKEGGWFMISEETRQSMIADTKHHLSEKLWAAVLQSDTYELDDGAISNELRDGQNIIHEEDATLLNGVVPLNLLQALDRRSSQSLSTLSQQHHQHNQTPSSTQHQGGGGELFTSASLGSVGSSNNNNNPDHRVVIGRVSGGSANRYSPHSLASSLRSGGVGTAGGSGIRMMSPHPHHGGGDHNDADGDNSSSNNTPIESSSSPIPANSPLQKAVVRGGAHTSIDSTAAAAAGAESSLYRRRHPTASSQNLQHSQNSATGHHHMNQHGLHSEDHQPFPTANNATTLHHHPQRHAIANIDALEAELFGSQ